MRASCSSMLSLPPYPSTSQTFPGGGTWSRGGSRARSSRATPFSPAPSLLPRAVALPELGGWRRGVGDRGARRLHPGLGAAEGEGDRGGREHEPHAPARRSPASPPPLGASSRPGRRRRGPPRTGTPARQASHTSRRLVGRGGRRQRASQHGLTEPGSAPASRRPRCRRRALRSTRACRRGGGPSRAARWWDPCPIGRGFAR